MRHQFRWIPLQDSDVYRRHPRLSPADCERDMHVVASDGAVYRGLAAVRFLAERLSDGGVVSVLRWPIVEWFGRLAYRRVADERQASLSCSVEASPGPPRWQRVAINVVVGAVVVLHLWAIAGPREEWPFTSNAMFAFYLTPEAPAYEFTVYAEQSDGTSRPIDFHRELGVIWFDRIFLSKWYGSTDPRFPQGHYLDDNESEFTERMADFGEATIAALRRNGADVVAIRIELTRRLGETVETFTVGRHDARTGRFMRGERT